MVFGMDFGSCTGTENGGWVWIVTCAGGGCHGRLIVDAQVKVAYVTIADPCDIRAWSGLNHGILRALSRQPGVEVVPIGPLKTSRVMASKLKMLYAQLFPSVEDTFGRATRASCKPTPE